jgi:hypothetical protein
MMPSRWRCYTPTAGFVHVVFDEDDRWGSLIDNLHVAHDLRFAWPDASSLAATIG